MTDLNFEEIDKYPIDVFKIDFQKVSYDDAMKLLDIHPYAVVTNFTNIVNYSKDQQYTFYLKVLEYNAYCLDMVPQELIDDKLVKVALGGPLYEPYHTIFDSVPENLKTIENCKLALEQSYASLLYMVKQLDKLTHNERLEMFNLALESSSGWALEYFLIDWLTADLCKKAVELDESSIEFVPLKFVTDEMLLSSFIRGWGKYIPDRLKTAENCLEAVKNGCRLKYIPIKFQSEELLEIVKNRSDSWSGNEE